MRLSVFKELDLAAMRTKDTVLIRAIDDMVIELSDALRAFTISPDNPAMQGIVGCWSRAHILIAKSFDEPITFIRLIEGDKK